MPSARRRAQWLIFRRLLTRGVLLGVIAAVTGLGLGYVLGGRTVRAAFDGLNWAAMAMFLLSGAIGAGQIRLNPLNPVVIVSGANRVPIEPLPWEGIAVCIVAGLVCAALTFALTPLIQR